MTRPSAFGLLLTLSGLFTVSPAQSLPFTFAWLSDTHIGSTTGADDLRATVADLNGIDSIAFVVVSGDITELGWNAEFDSTRAVLSALRVPYRLVPGNHDTKWSESGCTQFARVFGDDRFVFDHGGFTFVGVHQGPIMRMGDGHFAPEDLRWLDAVASRLGPERKVFFITHYPLDSSIDNVDEAVKILRRMNVQAVLVGHGHSNRVLDFYGLPGVMGRSNLRARQEVGGYNLVHVRTDSVLFYPRTTGRRTHEARHAIGLTDSRSATTHIPSVHHPAPDHPRGRILWRHETGWTITGAPAVMEGRVFAGDRGGTVWCLDATDGRVVWKRSLGAPLLGNPDARGGTVVFTVADGRVVRLRPEDGSTVWSAPLGSANVASPAIAGDAVFVGSTGGTFAALDARTGARLWTYDSLRAFVEARPLVTEDRVVIGAWDSHLYCFDRASGRLQWTWNNGSGARGLSPAAVWPRSSGDHLFIVAPDRAATVISLSTGRNVWRSTANQVRESAGVSDDGSRFYAKLMNDSLVAYDARSAERRVVWATHAGFGYDIDPSMPVEAGGSVFFGTKNGLVFSLHAVDGSVRWAAKIGNTIVNSVAPAGDAVVVTTADGTIAALGRTE